MKNGSEAYSGMMTLFAGEGARRAQDGALQLFLGTVVTPDPLTIDVAGTLQRADEGKLWCNPELILDRDIETTAGMSGPAGYLRSGLETIPITGGTLDYSHAYVHKPPLFAVGDRLVLLTADQQTFYIICKEVALT